MGGLDVEIGNMGEGLRGGEEKQYNHILIK